MPTSGARKVTFLVKMSRRGGVYRIRVLKSSLVRQRSQEVALPGAGQYQTSAGYLAWFQVPVLRGFI